MLLAQLGHQQVVGMAKQLFPRPGDTAAVAGTRALPEPFAPSPRADQHCPRTFKPAHCRIATRRAFNYFHEDKQKKTFPDTKKRCRSSESGAVSRDPARRCHLFGADRPSTAEGAWEPEGLLARPAGSGAETHPRGDHPSPWKAL